MKTTTKIKVLLFLLHMELVFLSILNFFAFMKVRKFTVGPSHKRVEVNKIKAYSLKKEKKHTLADFFCKKHTLADF